MGLGNIYMEILVSLFIYKKDVDEYALDDNCTLRQMYDGICLHTKGSMHRLNLNVLYQ